MLSRALRLSHRAGKVEPEPGFHRLWECNEPPSEHEKAAISLKIERLKTDLQKIRSNSRLTPALAAERTREVKIDIQRHKILLSCIRYLPPETWEIIFELVLRHSNAGSNRFKNRYDIIMQRLCAVCSYWNAIVKGKRRLWTSLPLLIFGDETPNVIRPSMYRAVERRLELYLTLSHPLPLALTYVHGVGATTPDHRYFPIRVLERLMKESHRWYTATLTVPLELMDRLSCVRKRMNALRKLNLTIHPSISPSFDANVSLSAFSLAPLLCHAVFDPRYEMDEVDILELQTALPWAQLKTYACNSNFDVTYDVVLQAAKKQLTSVTCTAHTLRCTSPQTLPLRLPFLRKLHLRVGVWMYDGSDPMPGNVVLNHLAQLTLPALEDLEVREDALDADDDLLKAAIELTRRSNCFLKRLALDEKVPFGIHTDPFFGGRFELWANLTHLDMRCPPGDDIAMLNPRVLGPTSLVMPKLQVLVLRRNALERQLSLADAQDSVVNTKAFLSMLRSRGWDPHTGSRVSQNKAPVSLREVRFVYAEAPFIKGQRWAQLKAFEASREIPFGDADIEPRRVEAWARDLGDIFCSSCSRPHAGNIAQSAMSSLIKDLERLDLRGRCSRVLVRRGIVHLLHQANFKSGSSIPGDPTFQFRQRARHLCKAWKPYLLRDHRASPYRLCYSGSHSSATLRIKYVPRGSHHDTDDDAWNEIIGLDINYNELLSPVGR